MSKEKSSPALTPLERTRNLTHEETEVWQAVKPLFEGDIRAVMFSLHSSNGKRGNGFVSSEKNIEIDIVFLEGPHKDCLLSGTIKESLNDYRTQEEEANNEDNYQTITKAMIVNRSLVIKGTIKNNAQRSSS